MLTTEFINVSYIAMKLQEYIEKQHKTRLGGCTKRQLASELEITDRQLYNIVNNGASRKMSIRIREWSNGEVSILEAMGIE